MKWFGEPWPSAELRAPVCEDDLDRVPLPPGEDCGMCGNPIEEGSRGVVIPHMEVLDASQGLTMTEIRYYHIDCLIANVLPRQESVEDGTEGGYTAYPAGHEGAMRDYHRRMDRRGWQEPETGPGKTVRP